MENIINKISIKYPCRERLIKELYKYLLNGEEMYDALYVYGQSGIGKSVILSQFLEFGNAVDKYTIINCVECFSQEILFETILTDLIDTNEPVKCKNMMNFIRLAKKLDGARSYVICIENAEELRDMEFNLLPCFLKLRELINQNICTILVSTIPFEKFHSKIGAFNAIQIYVDAYTKSEMGKVLLSDYDNIKRHVINNYEKITDKALMERKLIQFSELDKDFYGSYVSILLNVFYRVTRDVNELKNVSKFCYEKYIDPIINDNLPKSDVGKLWKNITQTFLSVLRNLQIGTYNYEEELGLYDQNNQQLSNHLQLTQLELPYYTKFLLIAAFLASNNSPKDDKRLFMKNTGKSYKKKSSKTTSKVTEKMITQLGPQSFSIDRLLAIFYSILEEKVDLNAKLLSQISNLAHLRLLRFVSGEHNLLEGTARLQCTVGLDFILHVGRSLGFNVRQYLCDFL